VEQPKRSEACRPAPRAYQGAPTTLRAQGVAPQRTPARRRRAGPLIRAAGAPAGHWPKRDAGPASRPILPETAWAPATGRATWRDQAPSPRLSDGFSVLVPMAFPPRGSLSTLPGTAGGDSQSRRVPRDSGMSAAGGHRRTGMSRSSGLPLQEVPTPAPLRPIVPVSRFPRLREYIPQY